jgi:histidine ammonia-lyase
VFFTGIQPQDVLKGWHRRDTSGYLPTDLQQEIQGLAVPVAPTGSALETTVEDLQAQTRLKVQRARQAVSTTLDLLALDLTEAALWLDVRKAQDPTRTFGEAPTAAWQALRREIPLMPDSEHLPGASDPVLAARFIRANPAANFFAGERP